MIKAMAAPYTGIRFMLPAGSMRKTLRTIFPVTKSSAAAEAGW